MRVVATLMIIGVLTGVATACSTARDEPDPVLWRQLDAAENEMYAQLTTSARVATGRDLYERLSAVLVHWDRKRAPESFSDKSGTAVFYDFQEDASGEEASFKMFVTSGRSENPTGKRVFPPEPQRVYTCYRIDVDFKARGPLGFYRGSDSDEHRLECPQTLVDALGERSEYREPWIFDG
ncbi:hypothetical protein SAMN04488591_2569 [Microbacterium azadirachtae]|uniref:Uncharacterized protein n=2 Tax=Microbacterium azadirachtae TaxID=582680 RepID=A0A1I6I8K1_9MICO|nr:hypothetical protein SAMN04488591_2569 [Microbacterium azadirachtae]